MKFFVLWLGLTTGNFIYQFLRGDNAEFEVALERSFFQAVAILLTFLIL